MKLYYSTNLNPRVAVAVARHLQSPVEYVLVNPRHPDHEEAFRAINPNTLVPVLVEDGCTVWETDAVAKTAGRSRSRRLHAGGESD
jgi:glutathione S-transferase